MNAALIAFPATSTTDRVAEGSMRESLPAPSPVEDTDA
jgi:hypothetical protein